MKISTDTAVKLLQELLGDVELVEAEKADADVTVESLQADITEAVKPSIIESAKGEFEAANNGKFLGTLRSAAQRKLSIPKKDTDGKTVDEILDIIKGATEAKGGTEASEWKTKYEAAVQDYEAQIEAKETDWQTKYDTDLGAANKRYTDRDINDMYLNAVNKMPRQGGDPVKQAKVLRSLAQADGIEEVWDEAKKELVLKKDGKVLKFDDTLTALGKDVLPIATSTAHIKPSEVKASGTNGGVVEDKAFEGLPTGDAGAKFMEWASK